MSGARLRDRLRTVLYPVRWLIHNHRCGQWLRRSKNGERPVSMQREYLASRIWRDTGREPTEDELDAAVERSWLGTLEKMIAEAQRDAQ